MNYKFCTIWGKLVCTVSHRLISRYRYICKSYYISTKVVSFFVQPFSAAGWGCWCQQPVWRPWRPGKARLMNGRVERCWSWWRSWTFVDPEWHLENRGETTVSTKKKKESDKYRYHFKKIFKKQPESQCILIQPVTITPLIPQLITLFSQFYPFSIRFLPTV